MGGVYILLNEAKEAPLADQVTPAWLAAVAEAVTTQLARDFGPAWGTGGVSGVTVGDPAAIPAGAYAFAIVDDLPEAPGAIAYHTVDGKGVPVAYLALRTCQTLADVSSAISHEVLETAGDPGANRWADGGDGYEYALELCDAVESNLYTITTSNGAEVSVSDFLLPPFFGGQNGCLDFMGAVQAPFSTTVGGYQIRRNAGTGETDIQGKLPDRQRLHLFVGIGRPSRRTGRSHT